MVSSMQKGFVFISLFDSMLTLIDFLQTSELYLFICADKKKKRDLIKDLTTYEENVLVHPR